MKKRIAGALLAIVSVCALMPGAGAYNAAVVDRPHVIAAGVDSTLVLGADGTVYGMGENYALGINLMGRSSSPTPVAYDVKSVAGNYMGMAILKNDNTLWDTAGTREFTYRDSDVAAMVSTFEYATSVIKTDGTVKLNLTNGSYAVSDSFLTGAQVLSISSPASGAVLADGSLWTWGDNRYLCLGYETKNPLGNPPTKILDNVIDVEMGEEHSAAIQADGSLWTWGNGKQGQLFFEYPTHINQATTENEYYDLPRKVADNVVDVSVGERHTAVLKSDGSLWMSGDNRYGQIGCGTTAISIYDEPFITEPVKVLDDVAAVTCGRYYTIAVKQDGTVWAWGQNHYGQLGLGESGGNKYRGVESAKNNYQDVPKQIPGLIAMVPEQVELVIPANTAYVSSSTISVDGTQVEFQSYALRDANGYETNYLKLRDVAQVLSGTGAQFEVGWDGAVTITAGAAYTPDGTEMTTPFYGNRVYEDATADTLVNGTRVELEAILLKDDAGNGYTYYKLRDLGQALNFQVGWSAEQGIYIHSDQPYTE